MRIPNLAIALATLALAGCQSDGVSATRGSRAQRMSSVVWQGVWTSPHPDTANSWQAAFLEDGTMTISGPGMHGHGTYRSNGETIVAQLRGTNQILRFVMGPAGNELVFDTGVPEDRGIPVRLVRAE